MPIASSLDTASRRWRYALAALLASTLMPGAVTADPLDPTGRWSANQQGQAAVPPMGWNSWNAFNSGIDEEKILASAQALVDTGLSGMGYRYVNIDDGWWLKRRTSDGRMVIRAAQLRRHACWREREPRAARVPIIPASGRSRTGCTQWD